MVDFSVFRMTRGMDEILFGEIVRMMVSEGYPMIALASSEEYHSATYLMPGTDLFMMELSLKRYTSGFVLSKLTDVPIRIDIKATAILKETTFTNVAEMYRTNISNITKFPFLGDVKVHHDYNRIHVWAAIVGRGSKYLFSKDKVDVEHLAEDLRLALSEMETALDRFVGGKSEFVDETLDMSDKQASAEAEIIEMIGDPTMMTVQCPQCNGRFDTIIGKPVCCPSCGLKGKIGE